jgi:hypothetical protein
MDQLDAQRRRRRKVCLDRRKVLRRRREEQGHPDQPGVNNINIFYFFVLLTAGINVMKLLTALIYKCF